MMHRPVVDLPHPDSPTRPERLARVRPSNDTPSTALTVAGLAREDALLRTGKCF